MKTVPKEKVRINPVGDMVLIYHDEDQAKSKGGIILPDTAKEQVLTGYISAMPEKMKDDHLEYPFRECDRVIYDIRHRIPVDLMPGNRYFLINYRYIYGVVDNGSRNHHDDDEE